MISDGLACFTSLTTKAGMTHTAITRGRASRRIVDPRFKWVNIGLGNIKGAITGTCRAIRPQYAARYLAAYEYRYNRRFDLGQIVPPSQKSQPKQRQNSINAARREHPGNQVRDDGCGSNQPDII